MFESRREFTDDEVISRGLRAASILDDDIYQEAIEGARETFYEEWLASSQVAAREAAWAKTHGLEAIERELRGIISDGEVAASRHED